jgi:polypeptide N-acetylgalactosaminyltransferase
MQRDRGGPVGVYGCHGLTTQRWRMMKDGVISNGVSCIMHHILSPGTCTGGDSWALREDGTVSLVQLPNSCLAYDAAHGMATLESCTSPPSAVGCMWGVGQRAR